MIVRSGNLGNIRFLWRSSVEPLGYPHSAAQFVAPFKSDPAAMLELRRLLDQSQFGIDVGRLTDEEVLAAVVRLLNAGDLIAAYESPRKSQGSGGAAVQQAGAAQAAPPPPQRSQPPPPPPESPTFPPNHAAAAQAATLTAAAATGQPFCDT